VVRRPSRLKILCVQDFTESLIEILVVCITFEVNGCDTIPKTNT